MQKRKWLGSFLGALIVSLFVGGNALASAYTLYGHLPDSELGYYQMGGGLGVVYNEEEEYWQLNVELDGGTFTHENASFRNEMSAYILDTMTIGGNTGLTEALDGKLTIPSGTTSQYIRGNGTLATFPSLATVATSGAYSDLTGKPSLATVATSGAYADLTGKPSLATVATSGSYNDLTDKPTQTIATSSRSIVTSTGAVGHQVSATQNALVNYAVGIVTTASIGGSQDGYVTLEVAPTNSATASDWYEIGSRCRNGQALTLALALQSVQTVGCNLSGVVPAGYYVKIRSVDVAGTPSYSYVSGQEVKL